MKIRTKALSILTSALLTLSALPGYAADNTLVISSWTPPTHPINSMMWKKFIEMMESATDGKLSAEIKLGLAPPPAQMDLVQDGAADFGFIFHGYQPGRFVTTKLIELPGYTGSSEAASVAYWRVYEKHLKQVNEHRGVKLIALTTHGPAHLHSNTKVTSLDQVNGMKVRIPGGVAAEVGAAMGAVGISVPAPKVYETLASNAADGVVMPYESRKGFKLTEVATNVFEMPGGLYRGSFAYLMSEDTFADLPAEVQQALEDNVFGEPLSRELGKIWDLIDAEGRKVTTETASNSINTAGAADLEQFSAIAESVRSKVLEEIAATGVDASAAYEMVTREMAEYK